jgi:hypothetical protein
MVTNGNEMFIGDTFFETVCINFIDATAFSSTFIVVVSVSLLTIYRYYADYVCNACNPCPSIFTIFNLLFAFIALWEGSHTFLCVLLIFH